MSVQKVLDIFFVTVSVSLTPFESLFRIPNILVSYPDDDGKSDRNMFVTKDMR
jgi:hypothetical protein